ncbi:hypothetical protein V5O48_011583, partial [Marasmius crinis-equi]
MESAQTPLETFANANSFDVDHKTGFMPSQVPLECLPSTWELWESLLDEAIHEKLRPGDQIGLSEEDAARSGRWRKRVREAPTLSSIDLNAPPLLRRAHLVLTFLLHFYVQSLPPTAEIRIPKSISIPVLRVSKTLDMPPVATFADTVLYNWNLSTLASSSSSNVTDPATLTLDTLRSQTLFTSLPSEQHFYLSSALIELRGVEALSIMRTTFDEIFVGDSLASSRITLWLDRLEVVIRELRELLLSVRDGCDPDVYWNDVRPWFRGEDSDTAVEGKPRRWVFEGLEDPENEDLERPKELSGASAGQSSLVHALDCFLGVENVRTGADGKPSFMSRMQVYMPRPHRLFLDHLAKTERPLRKFVMESEDEGLREAFNRAVMALKEFRDAHMIIITLYIIGPARRERERRRLEQEEVGKKEREEKEKQLKGTGGTDLVKFLKTTREQTRQTVVEP